ncbi:hypothetical protein [Paraburkholderia sp. J11-2]|uniref:hypothetical protein n=1 Tax=Paraburkholderia sp. J11-2 TaxID=2805431 RepID=UPI002AB5FF41|nr:hypothetical protein [Paraburkholderia sp. J11-2]
MSLPSLLIGFVLGVMALWIFLEVIALAAKRRAPAPTMAGRKRKTGKPMQPLGPEFEKVLNENLWDLYGNGEPKQEDRGVQYRFMGVTGEE